MDIVLPNSRFIIDMLNPDSFAKPPYDRIISTDEWITMQVKAAELFNSDIANPVGPSLSMFWLSIINGVVPNGLRITRPDPATNIR